MTIEKTSIPKGSIRSIAVIGGGASGAVVLDTLIKQQAFDEIVVFEKRDKLGGIWVLDNSKQKLDIKPGSPAIDLDPSISPPSSLKRPGVEITEDSIVTNPIHDFTPSYRGMRTKTTERVMTFSDAQKWPKLDKPGFDNFTKGTSVQLYLQDYLNRHSRNIELNTTVEKIIARGDKYQLFLRRVNTNGTQTWSIREFDTYIVATGAYHVPYIPDVPGLDLVYSRFPEKLQHSKSFENTSAELEKFRNKVVLTVGGRPSASDIARFIEKEARKIYCSVRSPQRTFLWETEKIKIKPIVTEYKVRDNGFDVYFSDGTVLKDPDYLVYCTGYQNSYPFLERSITTGWIVPDFYQHIFSIKDPRITFLGLPLDGLNLRCIEYQAILVARYLAGLVELPSTKEQSQWCKDRFEKFGDSRLYHTIGMNDAIEFSRTLTELGGGVKNGPGKLFPILTDEEVAENEKDKLVFKLDNYLFD